MRIFAVEILIGLLRVGMDPKKVQEYVLHHVVDDNKWAPLPFGDWELQFPTFEIFGYTFDKGLHALMLLLGAIFCVLFFGMLYKKSIRAPHGFTSLLEGLVLFVRNEICYTYLGKKDGDRLAPFFLNFFFFILMLNIMGLIPIFSTATANINVTAGFALITFSMMIIGGVVKHGPFGFIKSLVPHGVPFLVLPIILPIELLGLFIKPFALTIRLFANMLAGHIVIFSLIGLVLIFGYYALGALALSLFIYLLEILVAFIQAYIFTLLSAMFVGDILNPKH